MKKCFIAAFLAFVGATGAHAAEITISRASGYDVIMIEGDIKPGSDVKFINVMAENPRARWVEFDSKGGDVQAALMIGQHIRERGLITVVRVNRLCSSACALAWLGGTRRYADRTAKIGFHAAFYMGTTTASGDGNAVVGAYLDKLGFSYDAIRYMTKARPESMTWLTVADAKKYGIEVIPGEPSINDRSPHMTPSQPIPFASASPAAPVKGPRAAIRYSTPTPDTDTPQDKPKITDRVGPADPRSSRVQRVVLYDEDPSDPQGQQYIGQAVWRIDQVSGINGQPAEIAIRADVEIPERKLKMTLLIRRNNDPSLPASHTVELTFMLPPDFVGGGVDKVPGILMKSSEQARATPLAGLAVKVKDGFFLDGLSNAGTDRARNVELLKERSWLDIPMVYSNKRRAIIAMEKGATGERAFNDAFSAWEQSASRGTRH